MPPPNIVEKAQQFVGTSSCYDMTPTQTQVPVRGTGDLLDLTSAISGREGAHITGGQLGSPTHCQVTAISGNWICNSFHVQKNNLPVVR